MKLGVNFKIDLAKIDMTRIHHGANGAQYLDLTCFIDPGNPGNYGDHGFITQSSTKAERDQGIKMPISGNTTAFYCDQPGVVVKGGQNAAPQQVAPQYAPQAPAAPHPMAPPAPQQAPQPMAPQVAHQSGQEPPPPTYATGPDGQPHFAAQQPASVIAATNHAQPQAPQPPAQVPQPQRAPQPVNQGQQPVANFDDDIPF